MSDRAARALEAAVAVAREHGLRAGDPVVLHDGMNVVVHLRPEPVVARVSALTPLLRPDVARSSAREVALAGALAAAGAPVVAPSDLLQPGPHTRDGLHLSFWRHVELRPGLPDPSAAGRALGELHEVLPVVDPGWTGSPLDTPLEDLAVFAERGADLGADPVLAARTAELVDLLRPRLLDPAAGAVLPLHGDAHPGNLLGTAEGWLWADLEDSCRGPLAWDQACLRTTSRLDGRAAVDALRHPMDDEQLAPFVALRRLHGAAWWFVHAVRVPGDLPEAGERLRAAVERVSSAVAGAPGRG